MSLEYQVKKPADLSKINVNDYGELLWWSYMLCVSPEKLINIIEQVGHSTEQVRQSVAR